MTTEEEGLQLGLVVLSHFLIAVGLTGFVIESARRREYRAWLDGVMRELDLDASLPRLTDKGADR